MSQPRADKRSRKRNPSLKGRKAINRMLKEVHRHADEVIAEMRENRNAPGP